MDDLALMSWQDISDLIWEQVNADPNEQPPEIVMKAVELILSGEPRYKVAKKLNVSSRTIKNWFEKYTVAGEALKVGGQLLSRWRMAQIEQQFLDAVAVSKRVLTADLSDDGEQTNVKLLGVQAQHARYILDMMLNPKFTNLILNINQQEDGGVFKASKEALDYIKSQAAVEASFTEVPDEPEFGNFGTITTKGEEALCHICGKYFKLLKTHVEQEHNISTDDYEIEFKLPYGALNQWETTD